MKQKDIDNILKANKKLDWVKRLYEKDTPSIVLPGQEYPSTHYMESSDNLVYPTIIRNADGKLEYLGNKARDYAIKTNTAIKLSSEEDANWFGENYKKGTNVLKQFKKGGKVEPIYTDNLNDKRLKAYNDSLKLYKKYPNNKYAIEATFDNIKSVNNNVQSGIDSKTLYPNLDFANNNKIKPTKVEWAQTGGGNYTDEELKKGNWVHYNVNGSGANGVTRYFTYTEPVQPVIYKPIEPAGAVNIQSQDWNDVTDISTTNNNTINAQDKGQPLNDFLIQTVKTQNGVKTYKRKDRNSAWVEQYKNGGNITAETIYSMSEQPKVILTPDDIKAESGFNFQKYFPMERDIPIDTTTSYNRDIDKFAWKNTFQGYPQLQELQKQQQHPQQIDSSYYTTKTPKGYLNVYDKSNKFVGYSLDNKTIIPLEPNFEDGGMIKAWVQKFSPGGTPNPYIDPYVGMTEFNPEIETNMQSMPFQKLQTQPINQSFNNLQPKQFNTQMQVPLAQSNMQPYSTPYQTNYNASNDQVNMDNKQADSMMGGDKMSKMNSADMALGASNMVGDVASGAINAFAKPDSKASAYAQGSAKAQSVVKPLEKIPILRQASKLFAGIIGGALEARRKGIENEETDKQNNQLEYLTRNTQSVNQPSYYGQYMAKYGANPKMMEQRVIDDIYSDFDKYMKLT